MEVGIVYVNLIDSNKIETAVYWICKAISSTGIVLPQERGDKNKVPSLQSKRPPRQEQEGSAEESARASHVGDRVAVLSIKGYPSKTSDLERQEQEAPLLEVHPFFIYAAAVQARYFDKNKRIRTKPLSANCGASGCKNRRALWHLPFAPSV